MVIIKKEYKAIDLFKFIASIFVVTLHTKPFARFTIIDYYFTCLGRIAVPFFFITTSFFFFSKEKKDIKRYTKRLSILYVLWFILELPIVYNRFFVIYDKTLPYQIINFLRSLIFNNTWLASWFIMACILSMNIIYFISKKLNNRQLLILGGIAYLFSLSCSGYNGIVDSFLPENMCDVHAMISFVFMPANSFFVALIYIVLGKFLAENHKRNNNEFTSQRSLLFIILFVVLGGGEVYLIKWSAATNDAFISLPFLTFFILAKLLQTNSSLSSSACYILRSMSILIYLLHPIFSYINTIIFNIDFGFLLFLITLIESLFFAYFIVYLSKSFPFLNYLY